MVWMTQWPAAWTFGWPMFSCPLAKERGGRPLGDVAEHVEVCYDMFRAFGSQTWSGRTSKTKYIGW